MVSKLSITIAAEIRDEPGMGLWGSDWSSEEAAITTSLRILSKREMITIAMFIDTCCCMSLMYCLCKSSAQSSDKGVVIPTLLMKKLGYTVVRQLP